MDRTSTEGADRCVLQFAIVFIVINLHALRNASEIFYMAAYGVVAAWALCAALWGRYSVLARINKWPIMIWLTVSLFGALTSISLIGAVGAGFGMARFCFTIPLFFAFVAWTPSVRHLRSHARTMVGFFCLACLTLPMQIFTGPVSWFAASSERAGQERFASLVGSLTSIGVIVGCYIALSALTSARVRMLTVPLIALCGLISLSKAAVANVALGLGGLIVAQKGRRAMTAFVLAGGVIVAGLSVALSPALVERIGATTDSFGLTSFSSGLSNDVSANTSALDRLTVLPKANFAALVAIGAPIYLWFGGGFGFGGTALVRAQDALAPMAHNQFAEFITVFGFIGGGALILIMVYVWGTLVARANNCAGGEYQAVLTVFSLYALNSLFANGTAYQPSAASILFLCIFAASVPSSLFDGGVSHSSEDGKGNGRTRSPNAGDLRKDLIKSGTPD